MLKYPKVNEFKLSLTKKIVNEWRMAANTAQDYDLVIRELRQQEGNVIEGEILLEEYTVNGKMRITKIKDKLTSAIFSKEGTSVYKISEEIFNLMRDYFLEKKKSKEEGNDLTSIKSIEEDANNL